MPRGAAGWPLHPIILALGWVMAGFVDSGVHPAAIPRVAGVAVAATLLLLALGWLLTRSMGRGGLVATAAILLLISPDFGRLLVAGLLILLVAAAIWQARRLTGRPRDAAELTRVLNAVTSFILALTLVRGIGNGSLPVALEDLRQSAHVAHAVPTLVLPDIYIVLLDGYPRGDTLERLFHYENSALVRELVERGFAISPLAHSNYMYTDLTLTAMFHGRHLVDIPELSGLIGQEHQPARLRASLNDAPMLRLLQEHGYTIVANATVGEGIALRRTADRFLEGSGLNEYERYMLGSTFIGTTIEALDPHQPQERWEPWIQDGIGSIAKAAAIDTIGPKLVFSHVPAPHLPVVVDADGNLADAAFAGDFAPPEGADDPDFRNAYLGELQFLNGEILKALDEAPIAEDAIVVLLSDHGSESRLDWFNPLNSDLRERFSSFFAARAPGLSAFPADVTPTNLFPILLDELLDLDLPRAEDRFFVSQGHWVLRTLQEIDDPFHAP